MLKLSMGLSRDLRVEPLLDGSVRPQNIELEFGMSSPGELNYRCLKYDEFDVFQMSIAEFPMAKGQAGGERWQWSGLPVFLTKAFLWLNLHVYADAKIHQLADLKGKRLGVPDYPMTSVVWMRIMLRELCGIRPEDIIWYIGRTKEWSHGGLLGLDQNPPPGISLNWLTENQTLDVMLERGELDAAVFATRSQGGNWDSSSIDRFGGTRLEGNPKLRKLFPDGGRQVISAYYEKTCILPSNHMFFVQNKILEQHPWVALELYKAFEKSKSEAYERARRWRPAYLLFEGNDEKHQAAEFGVDPYPLGIQENRKMLEVLFAGLYEEGLTQRPVPIEDVFFRTTLNT